ncbi:hypothetical protein LNN31_07885 [Acetobacterium wieringae]|uniref:DUF3168 domain-containing protein n=1 Tax=Acetobacterium wieringae TaxID=52694 RepID=A0ABY6HIF8_9FIRM|nr:hypothetical protein [Acetobacterium wieringae]UYO64327.1 hypothetical protein LNN31_07885 [Acetobacterium wieringae]VUZ27077.1 Uncharacterised protein [Acetobacterium wieringae]
MAVCDITNASGVVLLSTFNATYANSLYTPGDYDPSYFWPENAVKPIYFKTKERFSKLAVECYFKNGKLADIEALKQALKKCVVTLNNRFIQGQSFDCMLVSTQIGKISSRHYSAVFVFDCVILTAG